MAAMIDPLFFKPRICTWEDLSFTEAESLLQRKTSNKVIYNLVSGLKLPGTSDSEENDSRSMMEEKRTKITLDLFYNMILFSRKNEFNPEQLTALFTIFKAMHLFCISTPYDNMEQCFQIVQEFIVKHSVFRPPYSICLFNLHEVKVISEYILQTYFKHYKMYKYAFTKRVLLDLQITYDGTADPQAKSIPSEDSKVSPSESEEKIEGQDELELPAKESDGTISMETKQEEVVEEETLTEDQKQLKDIISQTLSDKMKEMKVIVEKELSLSDKRLVDRLSAIEAEVDKGKGKKKK